MDGKNSFLGTSFSQGEGKSSKSPKIRGQDLSLRASQRAEQEVARLRSYNELLTAHVSDWLFSLDRKGKIRNTSRAVGELLGYSEVETQGRLLGDWLIPEQRPVLKALMHEAFGHQQIVHFHFQLRSREGKWVAVAGVGRALPHPQSSELEIECIARRAASPDGGSSWKRALPEHFGFMLAHELSQPLTGVATAARAGIRLLLDDTVDRRELAEVLELAAIQSEQAGELIRELRLLAQGHQPGMAWVDLAHVVDDALREKPWSGSEFTLALEIPPNFPKIMADRVLLSLVVKNLVKNSWEAMQDIPPSSRRLSIAATAEPNQIHVYIRDAGRGFPSGRAERWLEPFQTSKGQGMGLGLALSRWIVEAHGGQIRVDATCPQGTVFHVTLPLGAKSDENEKP